MITETQNGFNIEGNELNINCITSKENKFHLDSEGNLIVNSITTTNNESSSINYQEIFNSIYPVGAIYLSIDSKNPNTLFGGVWEQIQDRFLLAAGSTYQAASTGGESKVALKIDEMPEHAHQLCLLTPGGELNKTFGLHYEYNGLNNVGAYFGDTNHAYGYMNSAGNNQPHNNMPPYLTVYMWKRIS
ncbi:MAG: hypothetical protein HFH31_00105 [Bacilli bacterium]|nr:hypothetical protein [Bacilli bacterium]